MNQRSSRLLTQAMAIAMFGLSSVSQVANASGFALIEQSASGQGLSYAGAAANAENASVMWFNPAGMTDIEGHEVIIAAHVILPKADFTNKGSYIKNTDGSTSPLYGNDGDGTGTGVVPNFYWKGSAGDYALGLGVNVPYGSTVEYDQNWVGRYHAVYTKTQTINLNPSIARKFGEHLSVGFGLNVQQIDVTLSQKIDFGVAGTPQTNDGYVELSASGIGYGYNLGLTYDFESAGKLGLAYRSQINQSAEGKAKFTKPSNITDSAYDDSNITAEMALPATASLSYSLPFGNAVNLLADATWTGWSAFDELRIDFENAVKDDSVQPEEWTDVMRYSLGATYQLNPSPILRSGVALDNTPITDKSLRTPRISDSNRTWFSVGAGYQLSKTMKLDLAYSHLAGGTPEMEATDADTGAHVLVGEFDVSIDIISAQLVWKY